MASGFWRLTFVIALVAGAFSVARGEASAEGAAPYHPLLLISLDAFRSDYCDLHPAETPNLRRLKAEGASARALISVYPSNTFPNHYTIVTGLWPAHHGVINNTMFDPASGQIFRNNLPTVRDSMWWGGEPIWVTAVKQGLRSACSFWPGSEAEIDGVRPSFWKLYDYSIPFEKRLDELVGWLTLPADRRPNVVIFYLEETNSVGHTYGPESPETAAAIRLLDTRVGAILERLRASNIEPNLVVVSDHGMTTVIPERCVALDDYIDLSTVQVDFSGPVAGLRPLSGSVDDLVQKLKAMPKGVDVRRLEDMPARFHLKGSPRLPPVWIMPELGGSIATRASIATWLPKTHGEHGYDPQLPPMHATLIVHGPAFKSDGRVIDEVENIHLYNLFCAVLHLKPARNDGDQRLVQALLK